MRSRPSNCGRWTALRSVPPSSLAVCGRGHAFVACAPQRWRSLAMRRRTYAVIELNNILNLRILYVLILITAVTEGCGCTQPEGQLASIAGTPTLPSRTPPRLTRFHRGHGWKVRHLDPARTRKAVGFERTLQSARRRGHPAFENLQARRFKDRWRRRRIELVRLISARGKKEVYQGGTHP